MQGHKEIAVTGIFSHLDDLLHAVEKSKRSGWDFQVYSPFPCHEIAELTQPQKSPVQVFTFLGVIIGIVFGFALTIWCSLDWPMRVSAKEVISIPALIPISYECTILFGACATIVGIFFLCRIPNIFRKSGYDPRFSDDKFGVVIGCSNNDVDEIRRELRKSGAEEVNVSDAL